jgi:hypothetical protein
LAVGRGWDREAVDFGRRALALAREVGDHATESNALGNIGQALLGAGDLSGYEHLERSLAMALEHKLEEHAARAYRSLLFYSVLVHDFARAERLFREGVAHCEERGIFVHSAYMRAYYTPCELERGNWTEAARMAAELLQSTGFTGVQQCITILVTLALVRLRRGDPSADERETRGALTHGGGRSRNCPRHRRIENGRLFTRPVSASDSFNFLNKQ